MMAAKPSNASILEELKNGSAKFELIWTPIFAKTHSFFAKIGPPPPHLEVSPALRKVESFRVHKVTGDGRCMFRALVKGMALNKSVTLSAREERENADELRMAIKEVLCDNDKERHQYEEAIIAITVEESLKRYCQRIGRADFWGGESELLVLSKLCRQPIMVYIPEHEHTKAGYGSGFIPIAEYGADFAKASGKGKAKKAPPPPPRFRSKLDSLISMPAAKEEEKTNLNKFSSTQAGEQNGTNVMDVEENVEVENVERPVDLYKWSTPVDQDIGKLQKECEEKDATIRELSYFLNSAESHNSKRISELEDIIRRKNMLITKLRKDMMVLEQKVIHLTRLRRPSSSKSSSSSKKLPVMSDNLIYDMDSTTSPSDDSDSSTRSSTI